MQAEPPPQTVLDAWSFASTARFEPVHSGLINPTWRVSVHGQPFAALQRMHAAFKPEVHTDLDAVSAHVQARGLLTPRPIRTTSGGLWTRDPEGHLWRALTWVGTTTHERYETPAQLRSAAALVGRWHSAMADFTQPLTHIRPSAHDTDVHLQRARLTVQEHPDHPDISAVSRLVDRLALRWERLQPHLAHDLPTRLIHGDLKASNLRFDASDQAVAVIDLDTVARGTLDIELGDMLRNWCATGPEDAQGLDFDLTRFEASIRGYVRGSREDPPPREVFDSLIAGTTRLALELALRFATDTLVANYFGWDETRYGSRAAHNLARATSQAALADAVWSRRDQLHTVLSHTLALPCSEENP